MYNYSSHLSNLLLIGQIEGNGKDWVRMCSTSEEISIFTCMCSCHAFCGLTHLLTIWSIIIDKQVTDRWQKKVEGDHTNTITYH